MNRYVKCDGCGELRMEEIKECPACGSVYHTVFLKVKDDVSISIHEQVKGKVKEAGTKKPVKEFVYGDEKQKSTDTWVNKTRIIDRKNNDYLEIVKDNETGAIIHECNESLTDHINHGSAKK